MKRRNSSPSNKVENKKQCPEKAKARCLEAQSAFEEAEPYRLATARFPIDALTPEWTVGENRKINESHKRRLCQNFIDQGVLRQELGNRLRVACTKDEVKKMLDHIQSQSNHRADGDRDRGAAKHRQEWPSFDDWIMINGKKAELMAGHHRVEALKEYLRRTKTQGDERWWICDLYDRGWHRRRYLHEPTALTNKQTHCQPHFTSSFAPTVKIWHYPIATARYGPSWPLCPLQIARFSEDKTSMSKPRWYSSLDSVARLNFRPSDW